MSGKVLCRICGKERKAPKDPRRRRIDPQGACPTCNGAIAGKKRAKEWVFVTRTKQDEARQAPSSSWWLDASKFYDRAKQENEARLKAQGHQGATPGLE